jgi:hypothetical protein
VGKDGWYGAGGWRRGFYIIMVKKKKKIMNNNNKKDKKKSKKPRYMQIWKKVRKSTKLYIEGVAK